MKRFFKEEKRDQVALGRPTGRAMLLRAVFTFCILVSPVPCAGFVLNAVPDSPPSNLPYYIVWGIAIIAIAIKVRKPSP